jgi:hypothetical protein
MGNREFAIQECGLSEVWHAQPTGANGFQVMPFDDLGDITGLTRQNYTSIKNPVNPH